MINKCGGKEFWDRMVVYVDTCAMDVRMIVRVKVGFWGKDTRNGNEGDDENGVRYSSGSPLKVMLTGSDAAKGGAEDGDVNEAP